MSLPRVFGALCAVACAFAYGQQPGYKEFPVRLPYPEVKVPPARVILRGYSLMPLDEKGWVITTQNREQLALAKRFEKSDERSTIIAVLIKVPAFNTSEEFLGMVKDGAKNTDQQRFVMLKSEVAAYPGKGADCATSYTMDEDRAAKAVFRKATHMVIERLTLICVHPGDKSVGVKVQIENRYYPEQLDSGFTGKATSIVNSVEFSDL